MPEPLAEAQGPTITYTTANHMVSSTYRSQASDKTPHVLHVLSDFSIEEVYEARVGRHLEPACESGCPTVREAITGEQHEGVLAMVRQFVRANRRLQDQECEEP